MDDADWLLSGIDLRPVEVAACNAAAGPADLSLDEDAASGWRGGSQIAGEWLINVLFGDVGVFGSHPGFDSPIANTRACPSTAINGIRASG